MVQCVTGKAEWATSGTVAAQHTASGCAGVKDLDSELEACCRQHTRLPLQENRDRKPLKLPHPCLRRHAAQATRSASAVSLRRLTAQASSFINHEQSIATGILSHTTSEPLCKRYEVHLGLFIPMVGAPFLTLQETSRMTTFSNAALSPPLKSSFQVHHFDVLSAHLQPNCRRSVASAKGRALGFSESDVLSAHLQSNRRHSVASAKGRAFSFSESSWLRTGPYANAHSAIPPWARCGTE